MHELLQRLEAVEGRITQLDWVMRRYTPVEPDLPSADPFSRIAIKDHPVNDMTEILRGRIVDVLPSIHWYKILPDGLQVPVVCTSLSKGSVDLPGVKDSDVYPTNTMVWLVRRKNSLTGVILGAEPHDDSTAGFSQADQISLASANGIQADTIHQYPFQKGPSLIADWSAHRPLDETAGGFTRLAETGVGVHVDAQMAFLRADENTGIWVFYDDAMTRVGGHNLQLWSAGHTHESGEDEGENYCYEGHSPYTWENLGGFGPGQTLSRELSAQDSQVSEPYYSAIEPAVDDQWPFRRLETYHGYLGQGAHQWLSAPPDGGGILRLGANAEIQGVFESFLALDGSYHLRSAKRVVISRRGAIGTPKRTKRAEDATGNNPNNYASGGLLGNGPEHLVSGDIRLGNNSDSHAQKLALQLDRHAYFWNWQSLHPFFYHNRDFTLTNEQELGGLTPLANLGQDPEAMYADPPKPSTINIDHRYGEVEYFDNEATIELGDDGSLLIADGYGAEVRLFGGIASVQAPRDLHLMAGRNLVLWGGESVSIRGNQDIEIAAAHGSIRNKAEKHYHVLAANGGEGSMLFHSKCRGADYQDTDAIGDDWKGSGIVFKAASSQIIVNGQDVYLRTGGPNGNDGSIYLDAGKGSTALYVNANIIERYISGYSADYFGSKGEVNNVNLFLPGEILLDGILGVNGIAGIKGGLVVQDQITVVDGHIATAEGGLVGLLDGPSSSAAGDVIKALVDDPKENQTEQGTQDYKDNVDGKLYKQGMPGNDDVLKHFYFSFQTTSQRRTDDFKLYEARWQTLARQTGVGVQWNEPTVSAGSFDTYPFPGTDAWTKNKALRQIDLKLFSLEANASQPPGRIYENIQLAEPKTENLDGHFLISD